MKRIRTVPRLLEPRAQDAHKASVGRLLLVAGSRNMCGAPALAALGELTGTATHEFNNVLMTILNYAKIGIRNKDDASRDRALNKILEATNRATKITTTILAQARNRSDSMEPTDLRLGP